VNWYFLNQGNPTGIGKYQNKYILKQIIFQNQNKISKKINNAISELSWYFLNQGNPTKKYILKSMKIYSKIKQKVIRKVGWYFLNQWNRTTYFILKSKHTHIY